MALYDMPRSQIGGSSIGARFANTINAVIAWNDARVTRKALSSLSNRELDDIGLVRGDIDTIANK